MPRIFQPDSPHFHAWYAWLLVAVTVVGFAPRSLAIVSGEMAMPPLVVHLHAAAMAAWTLLLALQATLALRDRPDLHRRLGLAAVALVPILLVMLIMITVSRQQAAAGTPAAAVVNNILFLQIRAIVLFPTFAIWGLLMRQTDPGMHKRLLLLATLNLIDAAIARMSWLPFNAFPVSYAAVHGYLLLLLLPGLLHDQIRRRQLHPAWRYGLALMLPWVLATELIWDSPWWRTVGPLLVGSNGIP